MNIYQKLRKINDARVNFIDKELQERNVSLYEYGNNNNLINEISKKFEEKILPFL